jgi:ABC-type transport system substrate-binding protein
MRPTSTKIVRIDVVLISCLLIEIGLLCACGSRSSHSPPSRLATTLTLGVGQVSADPNYGIRQAAALLALEGLANVGRDGKPRPLLAKSWTLDNDGRALRIHLRPSVTFHDGTSVTAQTIRGSLERSLKDYLGKAYTNIHQIRATSSLELEVDLGDRSNFVLEALDSPISASADSNIGTGPFYVASTGAGGIEMPANESYYLGAPLVGKVQLKPYDSFRAAWADMLRGRLDMLYEVGLEGLESLRPSSRVRVFTRRREYAYILAFNLRERAFASADLRRALNVAINRDQLIHDALAGHGAPADGPVWPEHWASDPGEAKFAYDPMTASKIIRDSVPHLSFVCSFPAAQPYERLALVVQRQLREVGVDVVLEPLANDQFISRVTSGQFQTMLADAMLGPTLLQQYQWWDSNGPRNFTGFSSAALDAALEAIDRAPDESSYRDSVRGFLTAIVHDPPAIFLAWSERARAVSARFQVPPDLGADVLTAIRLFQPVDDEQMTSRNY